MCTTRTALCSAFAAILMWPALGAAEVPDTLEYDGTLQKDGEPFDGDVEATFRLYDRETGGQQVWSETKHSLEVQHGQFEAELGSTTSLKKAVDSEDLWLEVSINGATLTPRTHVDSQLAADRAPSALAALDHLRTRIDEIEAKLAQYAVGDMSTRRGQIGPGKSRGKSRGKSQGLPARVEALEQKTRDMTRTTIDGQPAVVFTGVNVHVRNGEGSTATTNGRGNLVVGYNEHTPDGADIAGNDVFDFSDETRAGSHNIVVGREHTYSKYGGIVAGLNNAITGPWATVTGGERSVASGKSATVGGGRLNSAIDTASSVIGGSRNTAGRTNSILGRFSTVAGGKGNRASGDWASITGGSDNIASDGRSTVAGGEANEAIGRVSTVTGGNKNKALMEFSSVNGGKANRAAADWSSVSGGVDNEASGQRTSICGGDGATLSTDDTWGGTEEEFVLDD